MNTKCFVCENPVDFDPGQGGCYVGSKPHCSHACARKTLNIPEPKGNPMSEETLIEEAVAEPTPPQEQPPAPEAVVTEPGNPVTDDPYEFDQCTIAIQIMLLPDDGNEHGREVVIGVRNHLDAPIIRAFRLDEVPLASPVTELLEELKDDLSLRAVAHKMRQAEKASKPKPAPRTQPVQPAKAPETRQVGREPTNQQLSLFQ